jgi:hypothetical protein
LICIVVTTEDNLVDRDHMHMLVDEIRYPDVQA